MCVYIYVYGYMYLYICIAGARIPVPEGRGLWINTAGGVRGPCTVGGLWTNTASPTPVPEGGSGFIPPGVPYLSTGGEGSRPIPLGVPEGHAPEGDSRLISRGFLYRRTGGGGDSGPIPPGKPYLNTGGGL